MFEEDTELYEKFIQDTYARQERREHNLKQYAPYENALRYFSELLQGSDATKRETVQRSLWTIKSLLDYPLLLRDQQLLADYITKLARFSGNAGLGAEFGTTVIDKAMNIYREADYPLTDLYLAKARFLDTTELEHPIRERIYWEALDYTEQTNKLEGQVRVLLSLTEYYTNASKYKKSITLCRKCAKLTESAPELSKYYPATLTNLAVNYYTMFDYKRADAYLRQAEKILRTQVTEQKEEGDQYSGKRVLGTVLHYLGRIQEAKNDLSGAMKYFIEGHRYQLLAAEDLDAIAFYHLRMGELILGASLLDQARYHIQLCQDTLNLIVIAGSAHAQVRLAWATLYEKEHDYEEARKNILGAIEQTREDKLCRVELLCLYQHFKFELRRRKFHNAVHVLPQALRTFRDGELSRNDIFQLLKQALFLIVIGPLKSRLQSLFFPQSITSQQTSIQSCLCPLHISQQGDKMPANT